MKFRIFLVLSVVLFSCATIMRKDIHTQKLIVKDYITKKGVTDVKVQLNGQNMGTTDKNGFITFPVEQTNKQGGYELVLTGGGYLPLNLKVNNGVNGGYVTGDVALFLLGFIPGLVSLVMDGISGQWWSYKDKIVIEMKPAK